MKTQFYYINCKKEYSFKKDSTKSTCNCGNYTPFIKNGSCRFCYGYK